LYVGLGYRDFDSFPQCSNVLRFHIDFEVWAEGNRIGFWELG
jgi:hypothetical protein